MGKDEGIMRLWHKDLIPVLPQQQLVGQWRECCLIAKNIAMNGTPNHLLVNKVINYPMGHLWMYGDLIRNEMESRGYKCDFERFEQWLDKPYAMIVPDYDDLFRDWHNERYLTQCYTNLQEKYDCGGIPEDEMIKVGNRISELLLYY